MNRLAMAGMIGVTAFLACVGNGGGLKQVRTDTAASLVRDFQPIDEWSLWNGATQLRGANTWQKRPTPDVDSIFPRYTQEDLVKLAAWGANYVNLSIPGPVAENPDGSGRYLWDERVWRNLDSMVIRADSARLFVVVSIRTGPGRSEHVFDSTESAARTDVWRDRAAQDAWVRMWRETATRLRDRRAVVGYELMVEPLLKDEQGPRPRPQRWYRLAQRLITAIRDVDSVTPILVSVASGGHPDALKTLNAAAFDPGRRRIVFTVHQYAPWTYTHQPTKHSSFDCNSPSIGTGDDTVPARPFDISVRAEMRTVYDSIKARKQRKGIALAVNEFGVTRWVDSAEVFISEQMEWIEQIPANYALWLWDPAACLGWDAMNVRNGPDSAYHFEVQQSALIDTMKSAWRRNTVRLP
jgi:hypothetical protein